MTKPKLTKELLIERAFELFSQHGYHRTSIQNLAKACGLTKASIYHHITSKESLALDLIKQMRAQYESELFAMLRDQSLTPSEKMFQFFTMTGQYHEQHSYSSLLSKFLTELNQEDGPLWDEISAFAKEAVHAITEILPEAEPSVNEGHAVRIFCLIQSLTVMNKIWPSTEHLMEINAFCQAGFFASEQT